MLLKSIIFFVIVLPSLSFASSYKSSPSKGTFDANVFCMYEHQMFSEGAILKQEGVVQVCIVEEKGAKKKKTLKAKWVPYQNHDPKT